MIVENTRVKDRPTSWYILTFIWFQLYHLCEETFCYFYLWALDCLWILTWIGWDCTNGMILMRSAQSHPRLLHVSSNCKILQSVRYHNLVCLSSEFTCLPVEIYSDSFLHLSIWYLVNTFEYPILEVGGFKDWYLFLQVSYLVLKTVWKLSSSCIENTVDGQMYQVLEEQRWLLCSEM